MADHFINDASGVPIACRYVPLAAGAGIDAAVLRLQVGLMVEPSAAETAYLNAVTQLAALMDAEAARWKTSCLVRRIAGDFSFYCHQAIHHYRALQTYEERGFRARYEMFARRITSRTGPNYAAARAFKSKAGAPSVALRLAHFDAAMAELVAARDAAYPRERIDPLKPVFQYREPAPEAQAHRHRVAAR